MKRIIILLLALIAIGACRNATPKTPEVKKMEIISGSYDNYGILDSLIFLPTHDSTKFEIKVYQGQHGLMLESPRILSGNLFGVRGTEYNTRIKVSFEFLEKVDSAYLYGIPYSEFSSFYGAYILETFDNCWIYYKYDDMSNTVDMIEFDKTEFEKHFDIVKAHMLNY